MNDKFAEIQSAANAGAFGVNGYALPSVEQCRAGNYRKGRVKLYGLDIAIETPQGTRRMGKSDGKPWSVICMAHYGDISGTIGADGDPVDCYVGPVPESDRVFVVNQNGKTGAFDEHKVMLAFPDEEAARTAYMNSYEPGWTGLGSIVSASVDQFTWWLRYGNTALPFSKTALPYHGDDDMNELHWDSAAQPVNTDLASVMYGLRRGDPDQLLLDAVTLADIHEDADSLDILDALVVESQKLEPKLAQLQRIMEAAGGQVKPVALQISQPFKQKGTTNITALYELSDGQTVAIFFHNPDSTPNKILPTDELVSWKWLLNKLDVTILVAPEKGRDLNPREVARRIMTLAEKNSAKFAKANGARAARMAAIEQAKADVSGKEGTLAALEAEIADLTVKVEAKRAIQPPVPGDEQGGASSESFNDMARRLVPAEFVADIDPDGFTAVAADGYGIRLRMTGGGRMLATYIIQPGVTGQNSLGAKSVRDGLESAMSGSVSTAVTTIAKYRVRSQPIDVLQLADAMKKVDSDSVWFNDPVVNELVNRAVDQGYAFRNSTTQAGWTTAGIEALKAARAAQKPAIDWAQAQELDTNQAIRGLGVARINDIGSENVYVEKDGKPFMFKPGNTDAYAIGEHDFSADMSFAVEPAAELSPELTGDLSGIDLGVLRARMALLYGYLQEANADKRTVSPLLLDEYEAIVSEVSRREREPEDAGLLSAPQVPADVLATVDEIAQNYAQTTVEFNGAPITRDVVMNATVKIFSDLPEDEARDKVQVTLESSRTKAKEALILKASDLYWEQIGTAISIKSDQQITSAIKAGGLDISAQDWAPDFYRLFKISPDKIASIAAGALSDEAAAALKRFNAGDFMAAGVTPEDYDAAAKAFLEADLVAAPPKGVNGETLNISSLTNISPKPIEKNVKVAKTPADKLKAALDTAGVGDPRAYLNGVQIEEQNDLVVTCDGHRATAIEGVDLSNLPAKPVGGENWTVLDAKGQWIEGRFPDWRRIMPTKVQGMREFTGKRIAAYCRGVAKAHKFVVRNGVAAVRVIVGERSGYFSASYLTSMADQFAKLGYAKFKIGMDGQGRDPKLYAESLDGKVRHVLMGIRTDHVDDKYAPLLPDGVEQAIAPAPTPTPAPTPEPAATEEADPNIGRKWMNGQGEEVTIEAIREGRYYTLLDGKVGGAPIIAAGDLEERIAQDQRMYQDKLKTDAQRAEREAQEAEAEAAAKALRDDTDGYADQFPQVQRDRIRTTLAKNVNASGTVMSTKDYVRKLVAEGRVISDWDGERVLEDPKTGNGIGEKKLTKTAIDYAAYLIAKRPAPEPAADDQLATAIELLQSVINGTTEMDTGLADRLQAVYDQFAGNAEFDALFEKAAQAFADAMVAKARTALAA